MRASAMSKSLKRWFGDVDDKEKKEIC